MRLWKSIFKRPRAVFSLRSLLVFMAVMFTSTIVFGDWDGSTTDVYTMGNVGIGTDNPARRLDIVNGHISISHIWPAIYFKTTEPDYSNHNFLIANFRDLFQIQKRNNFDEFISCPFAIDWNTGNSIFRGAVIAQGYSCASDIRYKQNITPYSNALQAVMSLQGITYDWKVDKFKDRNFSKDRQIGFIAQDIEKVIPELVKTDEQGFKSVDYPKLSVVLVEAFKEQKRQNDLKISALEKENASLKQRLASLEKISDRIAKLESMMKQEKAILAAR